MKNNELKTIMLLMCLCLLAVCIYPVSAVTYAPGVSQGQYVKYGNIVGTQNGVDINQIDWTMINVTKVSGPDVYLLNSGQLKNGTALPTSGNTVVYDVQNGEMTQDSSTVTYTYGPIIAANLNEGDLIPPTSYGFIVNKTETRTYLNVSRSVNILNTTYSDANFANQWTIVYDKATGLMLEFYFTVTQKTEPTTTMIASFNVTETNIFTTTVIEEPFYLQPWFLIAVAVIVVAVIAGVALLMRRK